MKLPWMQFYPSDWQRDTGPLSAAARGAWIDILCFLWDYKTRGIATRSTIGWAAIVRMPPEEFDCVLAELYQHEICDISWHSIDESVECPPNVTIMSRRMVREERKHAELKESYKLRKQRQRDKRKSQACPTGVTQLQPEEVISHKSEVIYQKKNKKKIELGNGAPAPSKPKRVAVEVPEDYQFNDRHKAIAEGRDLNVYIEVAKFRDHHRAKGSKFYDLDAAFRTWLHKAVEFREVRR